MGSRSDPGVLRHACTMILTALLLFGTAFAQESDKGAPQEAQDEYREAMQDGKDALERKRYGVAARRFGEALRVRPNDEAAMKGFGEAIREMEIYNTRYGELKKTTIDKFGMTDAVPAIEKGLKWLAEQQQEDGRWKCNPKPGATADTATTAFALLAFLADGHSGTTGAHRKTVEKGIAWLLEQQQEDGSFGGPRLYTEGLCVLVITEAFVMGGTSGHYEAAQKGITHIVKSQRPKGGWMYKGSDPGWGDSSVTGMMFQPLKQGRMAYLDIADVHLRKGREFIDALTDADGYVAYRNPGDRRQVSTTAIGNLVRIYSGVGLDDPKVKAGMKLVMAGRAEMKTNLYFLYYGAMLAFLAGGDDWAQWRDMMKPHLLETQEKDGRWVPKGAGRGAGYADYLSDVDATGMALLSLQCCYRYVPKSMLK